MQSQSLLYLLLSVGTLFTRLHGAKWTYTGPHGEHHWSMHYPFCGGSFQSPIDIQTRQLSFDPSLRPIELQNYNLSANEQLTLGNNGHSVVLSLPRKMYISSLPQRYTAAQLHLHWGSSHLPSGSEHTINGHQFAAEMHLVHFNSDRYPNISIAADKSDGLAVLGVLIEIGEYNPVVDHFLKYINGIKYRDQKVQVPAFNIRGLLPTRLDEYYRYDGSLTTPPCYPSVLWTVFKTPVTISLKQFRTLATAMYSSHQQETVPVPMNSNFRKPHYTDNRLVLCSFKRGLQGVTQTVTSPLQRRHLINQLLVGDLADLADQDGLRRLLPRISTAPDQKWKNLKTQQRPTSRTMGQSRIGSKHQENNWSQDQNTLLHQWLKPNTLPSGGAADFRQVPSVKKNHQNKLPLWKSGLSQDDMLCYLCLEQKVSDQLNRGRSDLPADTQLVQALRDTLFPELNLRSYLGCKSDLALSTIRQLIRGRPDTDEVQEFDHALVKALGGVEERGSAKKQQTNILPKVSPGVGHAVLPRKPYQTIPWLQPMEWED
ncbi:carbonic anhydrase 12 [Esox lucius]|uniref:Carbonic anhydrase n=1 Tax=Esox lucius TaxID=8010 RepID=A0A3P8ZF48_ESOLU|nr:carbonic anhydrase 12 [Esox lucius]